MNQMDKLWLDAVRGETPRKLKVRVAGKSMFPTFRAGDTAIVEPVAVDDLHIGDFIFFRHGHTGYLHRYLGRREDHVLTKGDAHYWMDAPVAPGDVLGRVSEVHRGTRRIFSRTQHPVCQKAAGLVHTMIGEVYSQLRRVKHWLIGVFSLVLLLTVVTGVFASVGLVDFYAEAGEAEIFIFWETASETGNLGFYIERRVGETGDFTPVDVEYIDDSGVTRTDNFIPSYGDGGSYEVTDSQVDVGVMYYYLLRDLEENGTSNDLGITSARIEPPTPTPTTPPPPTKTPTPTPTPLPNVLFWADPDQVDAGDCTTVLWQTSNIKAVYFNGSPVGGTGAQAFCPCEDQSYTLTVYYNDGSSAQRTITVDVTGYCPGSPSAIATATQSPVQTSTPLPTLSPQNDDNATVTRMIPATRTPTARPTSSTGGNSDLPTATSTPISVQPGLSVIPTSDPGTIDRIVIGNPEDKRPGITPAMWIGFAVIAGAVFVGGGIWLWRQNQ